MRFIILTLALMAMFSTASVSRYDLDKFARYEQMKGAMKMKQLLIKQAEQKQAQAHRLSKPRRARVDYYDRPFYGYSCENMSSGIPSGNPYQNPFKPDDLSDIIAKVQNCGIYFTIDIRTLSLQCLPTTEARCTPVQNPSSILYIIRATDQDGMMPTVGSLPNAPANGGDSDIWTQAYGTNNPLQYVTANYATDTTHTGVATSAAMSPFTSEEDRMQYALFVHGYITADMDASEIAQYTRWATVTGTKVAPVNQQFMGVDSEVAENWALMQGVKADAAAAAAATAAAGTDGAATDAAAPAPVPASAVNYMGFGFGDSDDVLPMNLLQGGAANGLTGFPGLNMYDMDNLVLKAYHMGQKHAQRQQAKRLRSTRGMYPDMDMEMEDMYERQLMQQFFQAQQAASAASVTDATAPAAPATAPAAPAPAAPAPAPANPTVPQISPQLSMCLGHEMEDLVQYGSVQVMGPAAFANPDMDPEERARYYRCATMFGDTPVVNAFAQGGVATPAAGLAPAATNPALLGMGMGMGMDMDGDDLVKMIARQRAMGNAVTNPFAAAALIGDRRLRKPHIARKAREWGEMGDSEDYFKMKMLMGQLQGTGTTLNLANGAFMLGDDLYEDGMYNLLFPPAVPAPVPAPAVPVPAPADDAAPADDTAADDSAAPADDTAAAETPATDDASDTSAPAVPAPAPAAPAPAPAPACGDYKGYVPTDGVDEGDFYAFGALVLDVQRCLGGFAVSDGINSDTLSMYLIQRQMRAPTTAGARLLRNYHKHQ